MIFPFEEDKQWVNIFWILSQLDKSCIESLLGRIYSDTKNEDQSLKIAELIDLLSDDEYTVRPQIGDRVYVEIIQSQECSTQDQCEVETQKEYMGKTDEIQIENEDESVGKVVNKVRAKKTPSGIKQKTLQELACFVDDWVEELEKTREPLFVLIYRNPYWFIPKRKKCRSLYDYLLSCGIEQIVAVIKIVYDSTTELQKSEKLSKLNEIFNKDFYEIAVASNYLEIKKITIVYL